MKIKTSELVGPTLDWAVAKCERSLAANANNFFDFSDFHFCPSTDWSQGGPIIEREQITLDLTDVLFDHDTDTAVLLDKPEWWASIGEVTGRGSSPLVAAMRAYVFSKLGDSVEVPEEMS